MGPLEFELRVLLTAIGAMTTFCCYSPTPASKGLCENLNKCLIKREVWMAADPSGPIECMTEPVDLVIIHHTLTRPCSTFLTCRKAVRRLQRMHRRRNRWFDVGYHFVIGSDGNVYEGRPWHKVGAHTKYHNKKSISIAFLGDYNVECPASTMLDLVPKIIYCGVEKGYIAADFKVIGHRDAYCTSCPGDMLYDAIKKWPVFAKDVPIPSYTCDALNTTSAPKPESTATTKLTNTTHESVTTAIAPTTTDSSEMTTITPPTTTVQSVYFYIIFSNKHLPCCISGLKFNGTYLKK